MPHAVTVPPLRYNRAVLRVGASVLCAALATIGLHTLFPIPLALVGGWGVGGMVLLTIVWRTIWAADPADTRARAGAEDPGRTAMYGLVVLTSAASVMAAVPLARHAANLAPGHARALVTLCLAAVAISWCITHTAFALRYAHLYYRDDAEGVGGLDFPGGAAPSYFDFAYFAFTLGMCFQTSDVCVSSAQIRRTVLVHTTLSFAYNSAILAFVLNLSFGFMG